jgi:hypothetical protein
MKRSLFTVLLFVLIALAVVPPAIAQNNENPANYALYNYYTLASGKSYANNQTDTLPQPPAATGISVGTKLGGASRLSLQITPLDSMYSVVYVDEKIGTKWTNILQDSVLTATADSVKEFVIRSTTIEKTAKTGGTYRMRLNCPAWHTQGLPDATDNPTYTVKWLWKP